ncbi:hypothetical protein TSMEX_011139 [Taenia solium]|eukprot:TsM_000413200 transcript=TsM_000413200 gene=TsM_000413200
MPFRLRPSILRLSIFIINAILELFGVFILGLSIFVSINKSNTPEILGNYLLNGGVYSAFFSSIFLIILPAWGSIALKRHTVMSEMNKTLYREYGKRGFITDSWNFVQSYLRCCAVEDNGWSAYHGSWWDLSVNAYFYSVDSQLPGI